MRKTSLHLLATLAVGIVALPAVSVAAPPEGKIAINYNRCDKNYEGWGLHTWKNPGIPLPGVEWTKPLPPAGTNDFGIYWVTDFAEYGGSGNVNYIIHKGDSKEQGGKDMKFDGKTYKEIWVNSGDRKMYYTLEEAKAGRAESPCP